MGLPEILILILVLVVGLLIARVVRSKPAPAPAAPPRPLAMPADLQSRVRTLVADGKKINAVKEVRDATGASLLDAKNAVDAIAAGRAVPTTAPSPRADLAYRARALAATSPTDAVNLVVTETGMSAPEARAFLRSLLEP